MVNSRVESSEQLSIARSRWIAYDLAAYAQSQASSSGDRSFHVYECASVLMKSSSRSIFRPIKPCSWEYCIKVSSVFRLTSPSP